MLKTLPDPIRRGTRLRRERMSWQFRVYGSVALSVGGALTAMGAWTIGSGDAGVGAALLVTGTVCVGLLVANFTPYLEIWSEGAFVRNAIWGYWIPWSEIENIVPSLKILFTLHEGRLIKPYAVQNTNLTVMLKREGRVERVIGEIAPVWEAHKQGSSRTSGGVVKRLMLVPPWIVVAYMALIAVLLFAPHLVSMH